MDPLPHLLFFLISQKKILSIDRHTTNKKIYTNKTKLRINEHIITSFTLVLKECSGIEWNSTTTIEQKWTFFPTNKSGINNRNQFTRSIFILVGSVEKVPSLLNSNLI